MAHWGSEDLELAFRAWLLGFELVVQPAALVYHLFRERSPYPVDGTQVLHNLLRMAFLHFGDDRFARVLAHYQGWAEFHRSLVLLMGSDAPARRRELRGARVRDDDMFVEQFACAL
jgi:GT2 family glycosyltransferase